MKLNSASLTPKSGNDTDITDYRPMSVQSQLSKLFVSLVLNCIKSLVVKRVRRKLLRFVGFVQSIPHLAYDYTNILNTLDLPTIAECTRMLNLKFLDGFIKN